MKWNICFWWMNLTNNIQKLFRSIGVCVRFIRFWRGEKLFPCRTHTGLSLQRKCSGNSFLLHISFYFHLINESIFAGFPCDGSIRKLCAAMDLPAVVRSTRSTDVFPWNTQFGKLQGFNVQLTIGHIGHKFEQFIVSVSMIMTEWVWCF